MDDNLYMYLKDALDTQNCGQANWYKLGLKCDIPRRELDKLKNEYLKDGGSPTDCLFKILEARGEKEPTIKDLVNVLLGLGRRDIVSDWDWRQQTVGATNV